MDEIASSELEEGGDVLPHRMKGENIVRWKSLSRQAGRQKLARIHNLCYAEHN